MRTYATRARIEKRCWDVDDDYLVVPELQVFEHYGFKEGDEIIVVIWSAERNADVVEFVPAERTRRTNRRRTGKA